MLVAPLGPAATPMTVPSPNRGVQTALAERAVLGHIAAPECTHVPAQNLVVNVAETHRPWCEANPLPKSRVLWSFVALATLARAAWTARKRRSHSALRAWESVKVLTAFL